MSETSINTDSLPESMPLVRSANEELSSKIVVALQAAGYIVPSNKDAVMTLLTSGAPRAGDWRNLLEKNLSTNPNKPANHATPHNQA